MKEEHNAGHPGIKLAVYLMMILILLLPASNTTVSLKETLSGLKIGTDTVGNSHLLLKAEMVVPEVILIPSAKSWLISLLLPYFGTDNDSARLPVFLVLPEDYAANFERHLLIVKNRKILSFIQPERLHQNYPIQFSHLETVTLEDTPFKAARQLARKFTSQTPEMVLTSMTDISHFLQASLFAAHFSVPVIPFQSEVDLVALQDFINEREVHRIYSIAAFAPPAIRIPVIQLSPDQVNGHILRKLNPTKIRNLIVSNPLVGNQQFSGSDDDMIHFAPYMSLLRKAPLVLSSSSKGSDAENSISSFIDAHGVTPRTLTVLGDYTIINTIKADEELKDQIYEGNMELELFSNPVNGTAIPYGIGRLPFDRIDCLSLYYARLAEQERALARFSPRFTMIANLESERTSQLLLAESISRLTVSELRNHNLQGYEFYQESPDNPNIWETTLRSDLVIYEGHIEEFGLLKKLKPTENRLNHHKIPYFDHFPFLILQSCDSLESSEILLDRGISGIIGSCSKVHSASGSSFIKAFLDAMLYDGANNGEALRDAKNFSLSIVKLKEARGHREQDKTLRSALTFRLLGDPEVKLFIKKLQSPVKKPLTARFVDEKTVEISTPFRFYSEVKNEHYKIKLFPKAETAGIVTRFEADLPPVRQINAFYFFRLPINQIKKHKGIFDFADNDSSDPRNISLEDPFGRWLYILHYPKKEFKNNKTLLFFK
ncbi:hypothetical protein KJ966_00215 [bacterium]|nr:hypothetical protein [bacterium]